jgi:signal transduction histidine kinase
MRHGIMLFGPDRRLLAANALATEIGGLSPEELQPGILLDDQVRRQYRRGMYGPEPDGAATCDHLIASDRSTHWRRARKMPDGRVVEVFSDPTPEGGFVVTFTDVTAQAMAEAEAKQRAATLQVTMDNVRHGIAMYGPDRRLVVANRLAGPRHGLPELHERPGALFEDLVCEQRILGLFGTDPEAARIAAEVIGLDRSQPIHYQRRLPDGRMLDIGSDPTPDGGFVVTHTDVTDLEAAKAEASSRASILQIMLDNLRHGIRYFGPDHRLIAFNNLVDDLTENAPLVIKVGVTFEDMLQRQAAQGSFGDAEATALAIRLGRTLCQGEPVRYVRRTPKGRILEVSSSPTPDGGFIVIHTDVTELLEAQSAAADRAALLQLMLDSMRHGIALFDRDRRLVTANALTAAFNGVPAEVLAPGRRMAEIAADIVAAGAFPAEVMRAVVEDDYSHPLRRSRQSADGRVIEVNADPTPDGGFVATYSDVTALVRAEASARERADILQVMLDNIRHGICYYGPDRRVIAANALAAEFGGHAPGGLQVGRSLEDLIEEQMAQGTIGGDAQAVGRMAREMDRSRPARYIRQNADGRILEITSDPTPDGGFVVTAADISALVDAEQALRHRAGILQAMLDNSRQGIVLFDADGMVLAANGNAAALNGLPNEALRPGRHIQAIIADQAAAGYLDAEMLADALTLVPNDRPWPVPCVRQRRLAGNRIIEITTDRAGDAGYIRSYRDISDEQRARAELERARDAAEAANKAKSRFLATMSHELRTPLNAVIGFSEAFMVDRDPVRGREYVQSIHEAGRHLLSLIDDILDVTRSETTGFAITEGRVDIGGVAEGVMRVMQATAATAGVSIQARLPPILPLVRADELRLRQVLLNLVANAVKFTPSGGSVTLGAVVEPEGDLVMRVADTGIGMAPADIPRAFEAFTQLDSSLSRRFPGSGLGLYLSRALAEAQGASLGLESAPGAGTTAVLRIPKARLLAD